MVHKVFSEHRSRYHTFSDAFNTVLVEHKDLWQEARMEALRGQKRSVELSSSGVSNSAVPDISSAPKTDTNSNQKKSGAQRKKARLDALKAEVAFLKQGEGQRGQGSRQAAKQEKRRSPTGARRGVEEDAWRSTKIQEVSVLEFFRRLSLSDLPLRTRLPR